MRCLKNFVSLTPGPLNRDQTVKTVLGVPTVSCHRSEAPVRIRAVDYQLLVPIALVTMTGNGSGSSAFNLPLLIRDYLATSKCPEGTNGRARRMEVPPH